MSIAVDPVPVPAQPQKLYTSFVGERWRLFWLALRTSLITILTLGFYRFWMKTRLRRYYWSSIRPGGTPMEYVGEPVEKLLGFLIAVVFLAFYIGIVNLILMFASFALFNGNVFAYAVSFIGVIPIIFFARYRARRYLLGRTRWRGVRFALLPGAWGYAWRALAYWLLTIVTLGLLWPLMSFELEKYRTDRTVFGSAKLTQGGRWQMLFPQIRHIVIGLVIVGVGVFGGQGISPVLTFGVPIGVIWLAYGVAFYSVHSFRLLTNHKSANGISFVAEPRPWRVFRIYSMGGFLVVLFTFVPLGLLATTIFIFGGVQNSMDVIDALETLADAVPTWIGIIVSMVVYFSTFLLWGVVKQVFITLPLMRHYAETLSITGAEHLAGIDQRDRFEFAEAEGFAEALDLGAAI